MRTSMIVALACILVAARVGLGEGKDDKDIPPPEAAETQADALKLARAADLPAMAKADRAVIEAVRGGKKVTVTDKALDKLRAALVVKDTPPSGGKTAWTITFYRGEKVVRKVWVYSYGEWGVERPKGASWTLGTNAALAELIERLVQGAG